MLLGWQRIFKRSFSIKGKLPSTPKGEYLYGPHAVYAALINKKRPHFYHLYAINNSKGNDEHRYKCILSLCRAMDIEVTFFNKHKLAKIIDLYRHNGFILDCDPIRFPTLEQKPLIPAVDRVNVWLAMEQSRTQDNLGSILRSALYFGVDGLLYSTIMACPFSPIVARTSCGALESTDVRLCSEKPLHKYLSDLKQQFAATDTRVCIVGLDMFVDDVYHARQQRINVNETDALFAANNTCAPTLVIMVCGNEGIGLSDEIRQECDYLQYIEKSEEKTSHMDSISVNVAVSIALHKFASVCKQIRPIL